MNEERSALCQEPILDVLAHLRPRLPLDDALRHLLYAHLPEDVVHPPADVRQGEVAGTQRLLDDGRNRLAMHLGEDFPLAPPGDPRALAAKAGHVHLDRRGSPAETCFPPRVVDDKERWALPAIPGDLTPPAALGSVER